VLSHGTVMPVPQSQNSIVPAELSGRPCVLAHFLQVNQIIIFWSQTCREHLGQALEVGGAGRAQKMVKSWVASARN